MFTIRVKGLLLPWWKWRQISWCCSLQLQSWCLHDTTLPALVQEAFSQGLILFQRARGRRDCAKKRWSKERQRKTDYFVCERQLFWGQELIEAEWCLGLRPWRRPECFLSKQAGQYLYLSLNSRSLPQSTFSILLFFFNSRRRIDTQIRGFKIYLSARPFLSFSTSKLPLFGRKYSFPCCNVHSSSNNNTTCKTPFKQQTHYERDRESGWERQSVGERERESSILA